MITALVMSLALARAPSDEYFRCLAMQQTTWSHNDLDAENCMATILYEDGWKRLFRAAFKNLDTWLEEFAAHQAVADERYPRPEGAWPSTLVYRDGPVLLWDPKWMEGTRPPFRREQSQLMIGQVVAQAAAEGVHLRPSEPIRWSTEYRAKHRFPMTSRLLVSLAFGRSSYLLRTGHEEALFAWLMAQPDQSVDIPSLFGKSFRLTNGDVTLALLTIENLLSRHYLEPHRGQLEHMQRLRPIINTWDDRGDNFGAWYHLFGMALYTYEHGPLKGWYVATVESLGSAHAAPGEHERQEIFINRAGVLMGAHLRHLAREGLTDHPFDPRWLDEASYLDLSEFPRFDRPAVRPDVGRLEARP